MCCIVWTVPRGEVGSPLLAPSSIRSCVRGSFCERSITSGILLAGSNRSLYGTHKGNSTVNSRGQVGEKMQRQLVEYMSKRQSAFLMVKKLPLLVYKISSTEKTFSLMSLPDRPVVH